MKIGALFTDNFCSEDFDFFVQFMNELIVLAEDFLRSADVPNYIPACLA